MSCRLVQVMSAPVSSWHRMADERSLSSNGGGSFNGSDVVVWMEFELVFAQMDLMPLLEDGSYGVR